MQNMGMKRSCIMDLDLELFQVACIEKTRFDNTPDGIALEGKNRIRVFCVVY